MVCFFFLGMMGQSNWVIENKIKTEFGSSIGYSFDQVGFSLKILVSFAYGSSPTL